MYESSPEKFVEANPSPMAAKPAQSRLSGISRGRGNQASTLVLITAMTLGIILLLLLFGLGYVRLLGTHSEQKTAIQAASLAAARDISKIVINTNDFGYVGLSDSAPDGSATQAADNYFTCVHGINTLIGTSLLDYIIGDSLGQSEIKQLAEADLVRARTAADALVSTINGAIAPGGSARDKDGNLVEPYKSAEAAYKANQIRLSGASSYRVGSLNLSLGAISGGGATSIETPRGWNGNFGSDLVINGKYKSYVPVRYDGKTWVFAGIGESVKLIDTDVWVESESGLPYQFPTIIKAEAIQNLTANGQATAMKSTACAEPASVDDPRPYPGALVVSFPDGAPDGTCTMARINDLYGGCLSDGDDDSDVFMAQNGDFPVDAGSTIQDDLANWPIPGDTARQANNACKIAVYVWLKRAGTKANVGAVVNMHTTTFNLPTPATVMWPPGEPNQGPIPNGIAHIFRFAPNGEVTYQSISGVKPVQYYVVAQNQTLIESFEVLTEGAASELEIDVSLGPPVNDPSGKVKLLKHYDLYIRDYARRCGTNRGGKHGGEPINDSMVSKRATPGNRASIMLAGNHADCPRVSWASCGAKSKRNGYSSGSKGSIPNIMPQEDFAFLWNGVRMSVDPTPGFYKTFSSPPSGPEVRSTYKTNGTVCEIRFRRQLQLESAGSAVTGGVSYVGAK